MDEAAWSDDLDSAGLPAGGRIPPGDYPSSLATALASFHGGQLRLSLAYEVELSLPRGISAKSVDPILRIFLFQGFPPAPFFPVYWPPGSSFGGGVPRPRRGALRGGFLPRGSQP